MITETHVLYHPIWIVHFLNWFHPQSAKQFSGSCLSCVILAFNASFVKLKNSITFLFFLRSQKLGEKWSEEEGNNESNVENQA